MASDRAAACLLVALAACGKHAPNGGEAPAPPAAASAPEPQRGGGDGRFVVSKVSPWSIGVDGDRLCFTDQRTSSVYSLARESGPITRVGGASGGSLGDVACGGGLVYWSTRGKVYRAPAEGGAAVLLFEKNSRIDGLAADATGVYIGWGSVGDNRARGTPGGIVFVAKAGTTSQVIAEGVGVRPEKLVLDDAQIYFTNWEERGVRKVARGGGAPVTLYADDRGYTPDAITADATDVYFNSGFDHKIRRVPKDGGQMEVVATGDLSVRDLSADAKGLYFTASHSNAGSLYRLAKGADQPVRFGLGGDDLLAADASAVYLACGSMGAIIRNAKP